MIHIVVCTVFPSFLLSFAQVYDKPICCNMLLLRVGDINRIQVPFDAREKTAEDPTDMVYIALLFSTKYPLSIFFRRDTEAAWSP
jgi:hypothetical protein